MRVALIADVHANIDGLRAISDVLESADRVLCLGDLVGYYTDVNEVIDEVRHLDAFCVLGNHDWFLLHGCPESAPEAVRFGVDHARDVITAANREWLSRQPLLWSGEIDNRVWLLCHGSPWNPLEDYLYADNPKLDRLGEFDCDVLACAQTHRPLLREGARPIVVNPGSVGQSRHQPGVACAAVIDSVSLACEMLERPYDTAAVADRARAAGAGAWVQKHL